MRCSKYATLAGASFEKLPATRMKDGSIYPCNESNYTDFDILKRVDSTPEPGKIITQSHGELINGEWVEVIDEQLTPEEIEAAYQAAKTPEGKQRDNWALNIIAAMKTKYPDVTLTAQDISRSSEELAPILITGGVSDEDSAKLMQVKVALGKSRLPSVPHVIGE